MTAAGGAVIIHFMITNEFSDLFLPPRALLLMLALGTISTVVPTYLISISIGMVGPEPTAVIGNVSTLVTIALAVTILGEAFTIWHALGRNYGDWWHHRFHLFGSTRKRSCGA